MMNHEQVRELEIESAIANTIQKVGNRYEVKQPSKPPAI